MQLCTHHFLNLGPADPGSTYRTRDEVTSARSQRDPIEHVRKLLTDKAGVEKEELKRIEKVTLTCCMEVQACYPVRAAGNMLSLWLVHCGTGGQEGGGRCSKPGQAGCHPSCRRPVA